MKSTPPRRPFPGYVWGPIRIAGIYLLLGALWIQFSDRVASEIAPNQSTLTQISIYKGWGYVLVTALLLYYLIRRHTMEIGKTEWKLRESEENYRGLLNQASDGIFIADSNGQYILVNEEACRLVGYSKDELLSMNIRDLVSPEDLEPVPPRFEELHAGESLIFERMFVRKDGSRILCEISARMLPDGRLQSSVRDITERKIAENALTRSESRYRSLFENMISGYARCQMVYDESGEPVDFVYLDVNNAFRKLTGLQNVIGKRATDLIPGIRESDPELFKIYGRVASTGEPEKFETYLPGLGSGVWFSVSAYSTEEGFFVAMFEIITERKKAEESLRESETRFSKIFHASPFGINIFRLDDERSVDANESFLTLTGYSREEVVGHTAAELKLFVNPDVRLSWMRDLNEGRRIRNLDADIRRKDGEIKNTLGSIDVIDINREKLGLVIITDITDRVQAQERLQESEKRYRELVQNANSAILRWKRDGTIVFFNEYAQDFFGYDYEEIIGKPIGILVPQTESTGGDLSNLIENIIAHPEQFVNAVNENLCSDGRRVWMAWTNQPIYDENGRVSEILAVGVDITERKRAEELLKKSHKQLLSFIEQAPLSIAMFDRKMNYLSVSRRWVLDYGRGYTDLVGRNHYDVHPDIPKEWKIKHQKGLMGEPSQNDDDLWIQEDGTKFWLRWAITPWTDEHGNIGGIIISAEDISERKRAEAAAFQNEMRYHRVLDAMMEGCQIIDFDWRYVYINDVVAEQGRYKPEELLNHTMMEMYPGIEQTELFIVLQKCMADREPRRMENRFVFPDGSVGWFELSIQPAQEGLFILSSDISERKKAESIIRDLARFPEENPSPVLRAHEDGRIVYSNLGGESLLEEWGIRVNEPLPPRWRDVVAAIYRGGKSQVMDIPVHGRIFETIFVPIKDAGYVNIYGRDVTERMRAEEALRESEERLRLSLEAAYQGLYDLNVQTGDAVVNRQYAEMLGYDFETFVETNAAWIDRLHPDDQEVTAKAYSDYINGLTPEYRVEFRQRTKDGGWKWILSLGKVIEYDRDGKPLRMLGTHTDITGRKQIEIELHNLLLNLEGAEEQAGLGSWYFDTRINSGWWSKHMYKLFGVEPASGVPGNEEYLEMIHPEDRELLANTLMQMAEGKPPRMEDFRTNPERGEMRILRPQYRVEKDRLGNVLKFSGTVLDITEHRRAEDEIRRLNAELERRVIERTSQLDAANKELEAFAYSISHDLRAPLRAVDGFTKILMEDYESLLGGEGKRVCGIISRETVRMGQLIDDLLSFSRLSRKEMHSAKVDMRELAGSVFDDLTRGGNKERIDFRLGEIPDVPGDPSLLRQVWINLIGNAVKFTSGKKRAVIEVGGSRGRDENTYFVRDNGAGFDMEYAGKLFGVFQRLHSDAEFEGTGVGLAIVQRVIHRHDGRVWAEGKIDAGATIHFALPRKGKVHDEG